MIILFLFDRIYMIYWIIISKFPDETLKTNLPVVEKFFFIIYASTPYRRRIQLF